MTDEKLNKYLKSALTTSVSDEDIRIDNSPVSNSSSACLNHSTNTIRHSQFKKKFKKYGAVAAAFVLCATALYVPGFVGHKESKSIITKSFTISAYADELDSEHISSIDQKLNSGWGISFYDECVTFDFEPNMQVTGEGIDQITYQIENGFFEIAGDKYSYTLKDIKLANGDYSFLSELYENGEGQVIINDTFDVEYEDESGYANLTYASEYTVDYNDQNQHGTTINIFGIKNWNLDEAKAHNIWEMDLVNEAEKSFEAINELMGDLRIKCTVRYQDGSVETKTIAIGAVMLEGKREGGDSFHYTRPGFTLID